MRGGAFVSDDDVMATCTSERDYRRLLEHPVNAQLCIAIALVNPIEVFLAERSGFAHGGELNVHCRPAIRERVALQHSQTEH
jgi:hypothetical protein